MRRYLRGNYLLIRKLTRTINPRRLLSSPDQQLSNRICICFIQNKIDEGTVFNFVLTDDFQEFNKCVVLNILKMMTNIRWSNLLRSLDHSIYSNHDPQQHQSGGWFEDVAIKQSNSSPSAATGSMINFLKQFCIATTKSCSGWLRSPASCGCSQF